MYEIMVMKTCLCAKYIVKNAITKTSVVKFIVPPSRAYSRTSGCVNTWPHAIKTSSSFVRCYHSKSGVYGYRPHRKHVYEVPPEAIESRIKQSNFFRDVPELQLRYYGLNETDKVSFKGILSAPVNEGSVAEAVEFLQKTYSSHLSAEFNYLEDAEEGEWISQRMEELAEENLDIDMKRKLATEMLKSQAFDNFLATKFVTVKRYGGEGAESMMGFFLEFLNTASKSGVEQVIMCMPHRGRLNLLTGMLQFPPAQLFRKLKGISEFPEHVKATGDVPSHFTSSVDLKINGKMIHLTMLPGPSHLEVVNPVSMGKTRARQLALKEGGYSEDSSTEWSDKVLNLQVHGDAAFAGQGVNQESLEMSRVPHFELGGTVHLVVNNQIGFTTPADRGRSSRYCTDLAKAIAAPVLHVNGDFPEAVVKATRIACEYQRKFRKDIFVDLNCYRQWGHNELDDPTFTNPSIYSIIKGRRTVPDLYLDAVIEEGVMTKDEANKIVSEHTEWLNNILKHIDTYTPPETFLRKHWAGIHQADAAITTWDTGVDLNLLRYVGEKSVTFPDDFNIHPHLLKTHVTNRLNKLNDGTNIDWATAEALAFGSLMYQGFNVRISGQDVGRGTFSHRHAMLVDQKTNEMYIPLNNLMENQTGHLEVANSILSEEAVLAFEYGMSVENPNNLIIWEAQFGDFFNGAQIPIDNFVTGGESEFNAKWMMCSGLVMMLPHGYDGAGPEHSSCRLERFLQLSDSNESKPDGDDVNVHIANPTTPAQYFHLLRKQVLQNYRKPLIIVTPKTLLRLAEATSSLQEMGPQTTFAPVIVFIWSQEEPQNMGAWTYMKPRFENLIGRKLKYVGRGPLATPAVGIGQIHQKQAEEVITQPFSVRYYYKGIRKILVGLYTELKKSHLFRQESLFENVRISR
ncbi:putative 2-oxoglutarate dehydrogenase E1 component DHKTD1 [Blattella germanica]|nr:putative 2-oxoglutarate dehydrogenase E1 component DHKTD1 [Blattella germanica]